MNVRNIISGEELDQYQIKFNPPTEEQEKVLRNYMTMFGHLQELDQLYRIMLFQLDQLFACFDLRFNDEVYSRQGKEPDPVRINGLIGNAVASARTLVESMEIFDKSYLSEEGRFKKDYISKAYDTNFSYRFIDFMRNYMQHGHLPISFDGKKLYFDLSELLEVVHLKWNAKLKQQLENLEGQLKEWKVSHKRLNCVWMLYEYFLLVHTLYLEFYRYSEYDLTQSIRKKEQVLEQLEDQMFELRGQKFLGVWMDERRELHGFFTEDRLKETLCDRIAFAEQKLQCYLDQNGNLMTVTIHYHLEHRISELLLTGKEAYGSNLAAYCTERGHGIRHLSFEKYYGNMEMYTIHRMFPYIRFEEGMEWNVSYDRVTIADFLRTFPEAERTGITVEANNVGSAGEFLEVLYQEWTAFADGMYTQLQILGNHPLIAGIDWISRIEFILQVIRLLRKSFASEKKKKPSIRYLRQYITRQEEWDIGKLSDSLRAEISLLKLVLRDAGYLTADGRIYRYDKEVAEEIEKERKKQRERKMDSHGTKVNCCSLNEAVEQLNVDLLYYAVLAKDNGSQGLFAEDLDNWKNRIAMYDRYLYLDTGALALKIHPQLPEDFDQEKEMELWIFLHQIDTEIRELCAKLEALSMV